MVALKNAFMRGGFLEGNFGIFWCFLVVLVALKNVFMRGEFLEGNFGIFFVLLSSSGSIEGCLYAGRVFGKKLWVCCGDVCPYMFDWLLGGGGSARTPEPPSPPVSVSEFCLENSAICFRKNFM